MSRTNIDIDDDLVATVMQRYQLRTKKDAVDYALRRLVGKRLSREEILAYQGAHLIDAPVDEPHPSPDTDR